MQGHDSGYYTQAEVNEFLADMQAQFDSMVSELRDRVEELGAAVEAMKPRAYQIHGTSLADVRISKD